MPLPPDREPLLKKPFSQWSPVVFAGVSGVVYLWLAFGLEAYSSAASVSRFLAAFAFLFGLYFLAGRRLAHSPEPKASNLGFIMGFALFFRLALLPAGLPHENPFQAALADITSSEVVFENFLLYDNDTWRYLWDSHVQAAGLNPYRDSPHGLMERFEAGDPAVVVLFEDERWLDVFDYLSYTNFTSVYPPLAQGLFRFSYFLAPGSVLCFKGLIVLLDLAVCLLLAGLLKLLGKSPGLCVYYAWNPLVIKEFAGSGHYDPLMILLLLGAFTLMVSGWLRWSLFTAGMAVTAKLTPAVMVPLMMVRIPWRWWPLAGLPLLFGYAFYWQSLGAIFHGISAFYDQWVFNPGPWALVSWGTDAMGLPRIFSKIVCFCVFLAILARSLWGRPENGEALVKRGFVVLGAFLLLSSVVMPWYLIWVLPLAIAAGNRSWLWLTVVSVLSYLVYIDQVEHAWWLWLEYGSFFVLLTWEVVSGRFHPWNSATPDHG